MLFDFRRIIVIFLRCIEWLANITAFLVVVNNIFKLYSIPDEVLIYSFGISAMFRLVERILKHRAERDSPS